jgi:hypothetical protein
MNIYNGENETNDRESNEKHKDFDWQNCVLVVDSMIDNIFDNNRSRQLANANPI